MPDTPDLFDNLPDVESAPPPPRPPEPVVANNDDDGDTPLGSVTLTLKDSNGDDIDSDPGTAGVQPTTTATLGDGSYSHEDRFPTPAIFPKY